MYLEYPYNMDKNALKSGIDDYVDKLNHLQFQGNFEITELIKSWINYEMQYSIALKQGMLERSIKGILAIKDDQIIISFELPDNVKNFITEKNLQNLIIKHLDNVAGG